MLTDTRTSKYVKVTAPEWDQVKWTGGLWGETAATCYHHTVFQLKRMFDDKTISHVVENFRICAKETDGAHDGTVFGDGDFYKWMEAALYTAAENRDEALFSELDAYIDLIGRAQQPDGYLSTKQIIGERSNNGVARMGDIDDFEVYNFGHLFTSACLHKRVTGKDSFLKIAVKAADYLEKLYDEAEKRGEVQTAVCPSHYMGLIELYRTTGQEKYLALARKAIELRDSVKDGKDDNQDRLPLKQHEKIIGHAVRANYLYAGVADLYAETGDPKYLQVLHKVWNDLMSYKIYLTGGCGALYNGASPYGNFFVHQLIHQAYGYEYQLPNITAYAETCASVGLVMWAYRMFLIEPEAKYFDAIERTMLNVNLAALSLDGKKFFYENMLRRTKKLEYEMVWPLARTEYITSYCCPPNLARVLSQSAEYAYMKSEDALWLGMYGANEAVLSLACGTSFQVKQKTEYPFSGEIILEFSEVSGPSTVTVMVRIPGWAETGRITVSDGRVYEVDQKNAGSYLPVRVSLRNGLRLELQFDMPVRLTAANAMVEENTNQAAVERGPLVYCMETEDASVETLDDVYLRADGKFSMEPYEIDGHQMTALIGDAYVMKRESYDRTALYQTFKFHGMEKTKIRMIPYYAWDNRGFQEMRIWMPLVYPCE
ncbi:MAG TPA: glycoside hydrolase family 127 protein [Lachnospiraceae bacterium]|nr:glycoside hydrolase family 127 protein [Lachnospiraceae bacterium]